MNFELKDILQAVGPNAALIFAAWIFMDFLQQRYLSALERYRLLISDYREGRMGKDRHRNIKDQVLLYKHRCELMRSATNLGLIAAILLILTLIGAAFNVIWPGLTFLKYMSTGFALAGLAMIIVAAIIAIFENSIIQRAIDAELLDIPELARQTGQRPGAIAD
ncbi:MAG: DUF2721 domain-containing protein [Deltaproteobacteria bacterium]|nr:DUF2721 domain-containing protein [Deltaproteobacteria bacterium]